jgi:hypothetical protein
MHMDNDIRPDTPVAVAARRKRRARRVRGIFERPTGSGIWWVSYFDAHGRRHREKVGPKGLAKKVYAKRKTEITEARFFPEKLRRRPEALAAAIKKYIARRRSTVVDVHNFERYGHLWATAPETAGKSTHEVASEDIEEVRERRRAEGAAESTWNKEVSWLRAFYRDLLEMIRKQPTGHVALVSPVSPKHFYAEDNSRDRHLSDAEELALRAALPEAAWPKVQVAMLTGLDLGVQFGLRWAEDVNFEARTIRGWRRKGRRRELKPYYVPISDDLAAVLRALPSRLKSPWVFPNTIGTGPEDGKHFVGRIFTPALRKAKIDNFRWIGSPAYLRVALAVERRGHPGHPRPPWPHLDPHDGALRASRAGQASRSGAAPQSGCRSGTRSGTGPRRGSARGHRGCGESPSFPRR